MSVPFTQGGPLSSSLSPTIAAEPSPIDDAEFSSPPQPSRRTSSKPPNSARRKGRGPSPYKRYSSEYYEPPSNESMRSQRPIRSRENRYRGDRSRDEYDDEDDEEYERYWRDHEDSRHPDYHSRRSVRPRPPRSHLNHGFSDDRDDHDDPKPFYEETSSVREQPRRIHDEEMGSPNDAAYRFDFHNMTPEEKAAFKQEAMRLPYSNLMNSNFKNHFVASMGEFVGTTMFLFFAFAGTEVANIRSAASGDENTTTGGATGFNVSVLLYISVIFGFSLMVNVWVFFRISGGLFNPAVTFAMVLVKAIAPVRAACLFVAQMCGALMASVMVRFLFPEAFNVRTTLGGGASVVQGVFIEAILTAELVFTIFMLAKEKHRATFIAPVGIGLALFIAEMVGVQFTGGSLNPARSFGPCVITATFDKEHWIYWVGPLTGSLIAVVFYKFIKTLEYEMANPGADGDPINDPTKNPEKRAEVRMARSLSVAAR